jgi:hypothetical protein
MTRPALVILLLACAAAPAGADESLSPADLQFFESKVRPLLAERCQGCHSAKAKKQRGGLLLDSRAAVLKGGDTGPAVVPGHQGTPAPRSSPATPRKVCSSRRSATPTPS